jgi:putative SOS response-associated peptidase YedK
VAEKPAFRSSFSKRRCLVIADGFYEWKPELRHKQPFYISMKDHRPFAFAGLWARWEPAGADPIESCTIITTDPNDLLASIHNRMPVILDPMVYECWLDPTFRNPDYLKSVLRPFPADLMMTVPVSTLVNSPSYDVPQCLEPVSL